MGYPGNRSTFLKILLIILLIFIYSLADDWQTYRCIANTQIKSDNFSTETRTVIVSKKVDKETWTRTTQIMPEKGRFTTVSKGKYHVTFFPEQSAYYQGTETDDFAQNDLQQIMSNAQENLTTTEGCIKINANSNPSIKSLGADTLIFCKKSDGSTLTDSITIIDSSKTASGWIILEHGITSESDNRSYPLPKSLIYRSSRTGITVKTTYEGYRVNEPVPDNTFDLNNEK